MSNFFQTIVVLLLQLPKKIYYNIFVRTRIRRRKRVYNSLTFMSFTYTHTRTYMYVYVKNRQGYNMSELQIHPKTTPLHSNKQHV